MIKLEYIYIHLSLNTSQFTEIENLIFTMCIFVVIFLMNYISLYSISISYSISLLYIQLTTHNNQTKPIPMSVLYIYLHSISFYNQAVYILHCFTLHYMLQNKVLYKQAKSIFTVYS